MVRDPQATLFKLTKGRPPEPQVKPISNPIWTENKARLIERYLYYFVLVTKHGAYIDGFAGPQEPEKPDMWAAKLVLESKPRWLRHFYLFDKDPEQVQRLLALKAGQPPRQPKEPRRKVEVCQGDFNHRVGELLASTAISEKEATFCLLDQRTFECKWSTLEALAHHKESGHKIELFYFLPIRWLGRALAAQKDATVLQAWWGRDDWDVLRPMSSHDRAQLFAQRFKDELGYASVKPWPIFGRQSGKRIMYYMIHATDHATAPLLMHRAYERAVTPKEPFEQLKLETLLA